MAGPDKSPGEDSNGDEERKSDKLPEQNQSNNGDEIPEPEKKSKKDRKKKDAGGARADEQHVESQDDKVDITPESNKRPKKGRKAKRNIINDPSSTSRTCWWRTATWKRCTRHVRKGGYICFEHRWIVNTPFCGELVGLIAGVVSIVSFLIYFLPSSSPHPDKEELRRIQENALQVARDIEVLLSTNRLNEARIQLEPLSERSRKALKQIGAFVEKYKNTDSILATDLIELTAFYQATDALINDDDHALKSAIPDGLLTEYIRRRNGAPELPEYGLVEFRARAEVSVGDPNLALKFIGLVKNQDRILLPGKIFEIQALIMIGDISLARKKCRYYARFFSSATPRQIAIFHAMSYSINCDAPDLSENEKNELFDTALHSAKKMIADSIDEIEKASYVEVLFQILGNRILQSGSKAIEETETVAIEYADIVAQQKNIPPDSGNYYLNRANALYRNGADEDLVLESISKSIKRFEAANPELAKKQWSYVLVFILRATVLSKQPEKTLEAVEAFRQAKELLEGNPSRQPDSTVRMMNVLIDAELDKLSNRK